MRKTLDTVYFAAGCVAAGLILGMCLLVGTQVLLNIAARTVTSALPSTIASYGDFTGFMLSAAGFLALPYTFRQGGHIAISLVTTHLPARARLAVELAVLAIAIGLVAYALWFAVIMTWQSAYFGDVSSGIVAIGLWIPQSAMVAGLGLFLTALIDRFIQILKAGTVSSRHSKPEGL